MAVGKLLGFRTKVGLPFVITALAVIILGILSVITARNLVSDTDFLAENLLPASSEILNGDRDLYQRLGCGVIGGLTAGQDEADRQSLIVAAGVDFARKAAA